MAAEALHHAAQQAAQHEAGGIPELPNLVTLLHGSLHDAPWVQWLHRWENLVFAWAIGLLLCWLTFRYSRKPAIIPRGWQNLLEMLVEGLDQLVQGVIGKDGRHFTPFIGTLFLYIWLMNLSGLVPGMKSPTSSLNTTVALALVVFCYVQATGMRRMGLPRYLDHLAGEPRDLIGWCLSPLMLTLHVIGEFVKPLSLSLRLCFNVFAEDVLLAVLVGLGVGLGVALHLPAWCPVPVQLFAAPLVLIFSTVQALVFSLLSTVYIALMLPHEDHHEAAHEAASEHGSRT